MKTAQGNVNGVDVDKFNQTIEAVKKDPSQAAFRFRVSNQWKSGGHNTTTIHDFDGAGQSIRHIHDFKIEEDEPEVLLGSDRGANPTEHLLSSLAGCLTTTLIYHAAARGITIDSLDTELEGELDLRGFLNLDERAGKGFESICVDMHIVSGASQKEIDGLVEIAKKCSPVYNIVSRPIPVAVKAERIDRPLH